MGYREYASALYITPLQNHVKIDYSVDFTTHDLLKDVNCWLCLMWAIAKTTIKIIFAKNWFREMDTVTKYM